MASCSYKCEVYAVPGCISPVGTYRALSPARLSCSRQAISPGRYLARAHPEIPSNAMCKLCLALHIYVVPNTFWMCRTTCLCRVHFFCVGAPQNATNGTDGGVGTIQA